jgi:hypothetical protein
MCDDRHVVTKENRMQLIDTQLGWRLIVADLLAAIGFAGIIGRVYRVDAMSEQSTAPRNPPYTLEDGESLLKEALRLKMECYCHRHF